MAHFRALKVLQASSIGLVQPGQEFDWDGNIIGWHVEPLDDEARRMVEERAEILATRGDGAGADSERLPSAPFPKAIMNQMASSGMQAPKTVNQTMAALPKHEQGMIPAPAQDTPTHPAPRRRKAG